MFDKRFSGKYRISNTEFKKVFYKLCNNAKKMSLLEKRFDSRLLDRKIKQLEEKSKKTMDISWINEKLNNENIKKPGIENKKNILVTKKKTAVKKQIIPKNKPVDNAKIKEIKQMLESVKQNYEIIKSKKSIDKERLREFEDRIKNLKKLIK